jgi:hypothetical protein
VRPFMSSESLAKARLHVIDSEAEVVWQRGWSHVRTDQIEHTTRCVPNGSATLLPGAMWHTEHRLAFPGTHIAPPMAERWRQPEAD